jgi:hypothetical protein
MKTLFLSICMVVTFTLTAQDFKDFHNIITKHIKEIYKVSTTVEVIKANVVTTKLDVKNKHIDFIKDTKSLIKVCKFKQINELNDNNFKNSTFVIPLTAKISECIVSITYTNGEIIVESTRINNNF